jgi:hypothetical protein
MRSVAVVKMWAVPVVKMRAVPVVNMRAVPVVEMRAVPMMQVNPSAPSSTSPLFFRAGRFGRLQEQVAVCRSGRLRSSGIKSLRGVVTLGDFFDWQFDWKSVQSADRTNEEQKDQLRGQHSGCLIDGNESKG